MEQLNFAKHLRHRMTESETKLWRHLRAHRLNGEKFRRQQPIGPYVVDFVHFGARLIVEADGGQHNDAPRDEKRDTWLRAQGFKVLRFWNNEIMNNVEGVLLSVMTAVNEIPLSPAPAPRPTTGFAQPVGCGGAKHASRNPAFAPRGERGENIDAPATRATQGERC